MDQNRLSFLGHRTHRFASPVSESLIERVMAIAAPEPGALTFDLGCGTAGMALHLAERWGLDVRAVDRSPLMIEEAARRLEGRGAPGRVELKHTGSVAFLKDAGQADLLVAVGAVGLTEGEQTPPAILKALAAFVRPGGCLLWGESIWKRAPSEAVRQMLGTGVAAYAPHLDCVRAGEDAGLLPIYATTSSEQEWDEYAFRYTTALENHVRDHPDDPDAAEIKGRAQFWRALYLHEARETIGFGLYLFRKAG